METNFMGPLDDRAAKAHTLLISGQLSNISDKRLCDWARFIMSIWFRTPADVLALHDAVIALSDPMISQRELGLAPPQDFGAVALKQLQMEAMRAAIDNEERGRRLINMSWAIIVVSPPKEFFISDWPFDMSVANIWSGVPGAYLTMPLSPHHLLIISESPNLANKLATMPERELVMRQNRASVGYANSFVGATVPKGKTFIEKQFGRESRPSLVKPLAEMYRSTV